MAEGVKYKGFLLESDRILREYASNRKKRDTHMDMMLENAGEHVLENSGGIPEQGLKGVVQFVHTLFEIAAAVTRVASADGEEEQAKLDRLHEHATQGLEMIGGEEIKDDFYEDGDNDDE